MSSIRFFALIFVLAPLLSEARSRRTVVVAPPPPPPPPIDCTISENFMHPFCISRRNAVSNAQGALPGTKGSATRVTKMGPQNAEGASPAATNQQQKNDEEKKQEKKQDVPSGARNDEPSDPNIVTISAGATISTAPVPKNTPTEEKKKSPSRKPASYETEEYYVNDGGQSGQINQASRAEPTQPIAWSVGGKPAPEQYDAEADRVQGFTGPGGRSNWEKVRQRYYDNAGSFERPDSLPPSPPTH